MGAAIGQILGSAVGVAISPMPIIAVILMLFSKKATVNSLSFLFGWLLGLGGVGMIVLALRAHGPLRWPVDREWMDQSRDRRAVPRPRREAVEEPPEEG